MRDLPDKLLGELAADGGLALLLDYDGTLSEITADPERAVPVPGVRDTLITLLRSELALSIAIVTGRRIEQVKRLLEIEAGPFFFGVHGLEFSGSDGSISFVPEANACSGELESVRTWLAESVPDGRGFRIEDKEVAIGLHYRSADATEAQELRGRFADFVSSAAPNLRMMNLKKIDEVISRAAGKGNAVRTLLRRFSARRHAAYLGDDVTYEDAFAALRHSDVGVLVGEERPTLARFHLPGPSAVADFLRELTLWR